MPLTTIPEKTEESLGIVKQDVLPYTDPATQVPAVQYERLKDAVIANALAIGLSDGSTAGSIEARLGELESPSLQTAYAAGNVIDTSGGPPVLIATDGAEIALTGDRIGASGELVLASDSPAAGAIDLHATNGSGGIRLLVDELVRLFLQHDGGSQYRLEPGTDVGTSLGSSTRRFAEAIAAVLKTAVLTQHATDQSLAIRGTHTTATGDAAVQIANMAELTAATGEQRLVEIMAKAQQSGSAALVVADVLLEGSTGSGPSTALLRARTGAGTVLNVSPSQVQATAGSAAAPGFAFVSDVDTGVYRSAADTLGVATGGAERARFAATGSGVASHWVPLGSFDLGSAGSPWQHVRGSMFHASSHLDVPDGSASAPPLRFASKPNTGIFLQGGAIAFTDQGTEIGVFDGAQVASTGTMTAISFTPSLSSTGDAGFDAFVLDVSQPSANSSGTKRLMVLKDDGEDRLAVYSGSGQLRASGGFAGLPAYAFLAGSSDGMYHPGAGQLALATAGTARVTIDATKLTSTLPLRVVAGSAGAPSYTFSTATDTGLYSAGANQLGLSAGGIQVAALASSGTTAYLGLTNGNIAAGTVPVANALYTKNVPKAWLKAYNLTGIDEEFGVSSIASDGVTPAGVTVTFGHAATSQYRQAIVSTAAGTSATASKWHTVDNFAVNSCRVRAWVWNGSAVAQTAVAGDWSLLRFATVS